MSRSIDYRLPGRFRFGPADAAGAVSDEYPGPWLSFKLLIGFLLLMYSSVARIYPQLEAFRPAMTIALAAIFMMIVELATARQPFRLMWPQSYMLLALLGVAVTSSFSAIYAREAFETTTDFAKVVLIYIVMENTVTNTNRVRTILWTLVLGGLFPAIGTIKFYIAGNLIEGSRGRWVGVFANPNDAAYAMVVLIPIAAAVSIGGRWWQKAAICGIIATYLLAIYLTFSRGGLMGLFAVAAIFGWKRKSFVIRVLMIAVLAAGLILVGLFWSRKDNFDNISEDTTFNQRIATIRAGWNMFEANPLFGVGPGCSIVAYPLYVPAEAHCGCQAMLVIHNSYVQILSEMGALGFVPWMVFLVMSLFHTWQIQRGGGTNATFAAGLELALWGFLVCSMAGGFTYGWFLYIIVALIVATKRISEARTENAV